MTGVEKKVEVWAEDPLAARAKAIWGGGDFHPIAKSFEAGAREFIDRLRLHRGEWVLDAACGTGNLAVPAAQAGATVTGIDIAANLISVARQNARLAGCGIHYDVGNVESMPYATDQFDTTVTMFGAMFAFRPEATAQELVRVTRRGGRVAMANWTPEGLIGKMLKAHAAAAPPPEGLPSPLQWGVESIVAERFGTTVSSLTCTRRTIELKFSFAPADVAELFASNYGPTVAALKVADTMRGRQLVRDLTELYTEGNAATDGTTTLVGEYLEVVAVVA